MKVKTLSNCVSLQGRDISSPGPEDCRVKNNPENHHHHSAGLVRRETKLLSCHIFMTLNQFIGIVNVQDTDRPIIFIKNSTCLCLQNTIWIVVERDALKLNTPSKE